MPFWAIDPTLLAFSMKVISLRRALPGLWGLPPVGVAQRGDGILHVGSAGDTHAIITVREVT
jgi:hypothetical protein